MELANQPDDACVAEDEVQNVGELSAPGSEEPAKEEETLGEEVIVRTVLGSSRRGIGRDRSQHALPAHPVGQVLSNTDTDVKRSGQEDISFFRRRRHGSARIKWNVAAQAWNALIERTAVEVLNAAANRKNSTVNKLREGDMLILRSYFDYI